jgi:hypothetical protein
MSFAPEEGKFLVNLTDEDGIVTECEIGCIDSGMGDPEDEEFDMFNRAFRENDVKTTLNLLAHSAI